jgi:hypothetical protein
MAHGRSAWILALLGLVPLYAAAAALWLAPPNLAGPALLALLAYAAAVLAFLGGARWGLEVARPEGPRPAPLALSVLPALAACGLLVGSFRLSAAWQLGGFLAAFLLQGAWDAASAGPPWHRRLRLWCSAGALVALGLGTAWAVRNG